MTSCHRWVFSLSLGAGKPRGLFQIVSAFKLAGRSQTAKREKERCSQEDTLAAGRIIDNK